jgi:hypothetical protein
MPEKIYISHRGNLHGSNPQDENSPNYILETLNLGYDVEIDVWRIKNKYYLGHDGPIYIIDEDFLKNDKLWCHAKNIDALYNMLLSPDIHCFFHNEDDVTLSSRNYLISYPRPSVLLTNMSIVMMPEQIAKVYGVNEFNDWKWNLKECAGVCSDIIWDYKNDKYYKFYLGDV